MPAPETIPIALVDEGRRMAAICNACRYCEGYCAVFPALERRLAFGEADLTYLANLCHGCGACYDACQYAPPHEFALDFPRMMSEIRVASYRKYAWPRPLGRLFGAHPAMIVLITLACVALFAFVIVATRGFAALFAAHRDAAGAFHALLPHAPMAWIFGFAGLAVAIALGAAFARFWRDMGEGPGAFFDAGPLAQSADDALRLRYLGGGGDGCIETDGRASHARRWFHHLTFYGFALCFAATAVATVYHYGFGWRAPYAPDSVPVILGMLGGVGLLIGPAGLWMLRGRRDPERTSPAQREMDEAFLALLFLTSLSGLGLLALRESPLMGALLAVHLGVVLALFVTMPYGKMIHAVHRVAALVRFHLERRRPVPEFGGE